MKQLEAWWTEQRARLPASASGLWFGIVELAGDGHPERMLYVAGCPTFDADDEDAEWATEYVSFPKSVGDYLPLTSLGITVSADCSATLEATAAAIRQLRPQTHDDLSGVAVGYDDGDFIVIWTR